MANFVAACPGCGAEVSFRTPGAVVVVCEFCNSVVARTDRDVESLGKVADLAQTGSPLALGATGAWRGKNFDLVGRAQFKHAAGGTWDEWYAHFSDGRWGWLAEAQGRYYLTFELEGFSKPLPAFDAALPGSRSDSLPGFAVEERGTAHAAAAQGEIPWRLVPGESFRYADLSGPKKDFATIDYSFDPPAVFAGWQVTLEDIGMATLAAPERAAVKVAATTVACPKCGGSLQLRAPDETLRVGCPYCGSLLDASQGNLRFLKALKLKVKPTLPLGSHGTFEGRPMTIIGFLVRSVTWEGTRFAWNEYLLYEPHVGFRWLVEGDAHWSFVKPVPAGEVTTSGSSATWNGESFRPFQRGDAVVDEVLGEMYWKVEVGEKVQSFDRIDPPRMLSEEKAGKDETDYSIGEYVPVAEIEKIFGVKGLARPSKAGAIQPNPVGSTIFVYAGILVGLAIIVSMAVWGTLPNRQVFSMTYSLQPVAQTDGAQVFFSTPFTLEGGRNLEIRATSELARDNWVYVDGDFYSEATGQVASFALPIEYYSGYEDGEYWQEGSLQQEVHLSALPAGSWTLRFEISRGAWNQSGPLTIEVREGVPRMFHLLIVLALLLIGPVLALIRRQTFEAARWQDADFTPGGAVRGDDDDDDDGDDE